MTIAAVAERTFRKYRAWASREVAERIRSPREAEEKLRPWLAIAAMAGTDLPELFDEGHVIFPYAQAGAPCRRRLSASDICPTADALAELARARDAALNALADDAVSAPQSTADLVVLAIHLGAPPYRPASKQKEAA